MDYGAFNPKDPSQWRSFIQNEGAPATAGINNMPYVLGGDNAYRHMSDTWSPEEVWNKIYGDRRNTGPSSQLLGQDQQQTPLQKLLGLLNSQSGGVGGQIQAPAAGFSPT